MAAYEWDEDRVRELLQLVSEGYSFSTIAKMMGAPSRNIPLCKFHRLRVKDPTLKEHPNTREFRRRTERPKVPRPVRLEKQIPPTTERVIDLVPLEIDGQPITIENVTDRMCRFPYGDPSKEDFRLCGHTPKTNSKYCETHHRHVYNPLKPTRVRSGSEFEGRAKRFGYGGSRVTVDDEWK